MIALYWRDEKPGDVQEFYSMHPLLAEKKGVLLQMAGMWHDRTLTVVIDGVCAENTLYAGAPFVGPLPPTETA
jgi:hypothetical protein